MERFSLPLSDPLATANGSIDRREGVLVRYEHRGETGIGEATPLPGWTESLTACKAALSDALTAESHGAALAGLDAAETPAARHGFATALLDADARANGVPLSRWLGGDRCDSVPVNATIGDGGPDATAERAAAAVDRGFDCLKLKVGARPLDEDVERVAAVRERVGDDATIRADANGAWDRETAAAAFERFAEYDVSYVEQPLPADDLEGHADLPGPVGVALDEALVEHATADVFAADPDYVVLKPMILGGPGTAHTLASRARELGIEPVITTTVDAVVARTAAVHVAAAVPDVVPCGLATADLLASDLGPDPAPVADGRIEVPQDPGLGIDSAEVSP